MAGVKAYREWGEELEKRIRLKTFPLALKFLKKEGDIPDGVQIENSSLPFKIENCTLYNSGAYSCAGILLLYVNNSKLINNTCSSNEWGIALEYSNNNTT